MSKLLYSNMEEKFNLLDEMFHESGFQDNFKDGSLAVYKKLRLNNENCYIEYENGEVAYVCTAVGTFFFNGKLESAGVLREVCEQYKKGGALEQLKEQSEGCYCLFIKDYMNDKTVIFVDDYNLFNCYYSIDIDGNYLVTNTYWHIAMALNKEMDKLKTLEYALTYTILDSGTPYTGISRLKGDEYLCIEDNRINIQKIRGGGCEKECII